MQKNDGSAPGRAWRGAVLALLLAMSAAVIGAGCGGSDDGGSSGDSDSSSGDGVKIAFMAADKENGYNKAIYEGVQKAAKESGAETEIFDGQTDADKQYNQLQDIIAGGEFDGVVIAANDGVGIASAVEEAIEEGVDVAAVNNAIGPDLVTLEPQVEGLTATVGSDQEVSSKEQAEEVVKLCEQHDPCRVVLFHGNLTYPFDGVRRDAWKSVLDEHDNIKIVAEPEGQYDRAKALAAMQDIIQANPEINLVLSAADQHIFGAELALEKANINIDRTGKNGVMLLGRGASTEAVERVKDGVWTGTYVDMPFTQGYEATRLLIGQINGEEPAERAIDVITLSPVGNTATKESLEENPEFKGEWVG